MFAYLSTVLAEPQRYVRFALGPATRISQVQVTPMLEANTTSHFGRIPPNAGDDVGSADLYDASSKPVQAWEKAKICLWQLLRKRTCKR
jgi:hypothetical protein